MKKILSICLLAFSITACAQHHHHHRHGYWRHDGGRNWTWVAPTIVGGVIGYEIARSIPPVIVQQPPVIINPPVVVTNELCSPWNQVVNPDGTTTYTRTCQRDK